MLDHFLKRKNIFRNCQFQQLYFVAIRDQKINAAIFIPVSCTSVCEKNQFLFDFTASFKYGETPGFGLLLESSINDVTVLGDQWFIDQSTEALALKSVSIGDVKICQKMRDVVKGRPNC